MTVRFAAATYGGSHVPKVLSAATLLVLAAAPGWGANPTLSLTLEDVNARQAVEALARASGTQVQIALYPRSADQPVPENVLHLDSKTRFDWKGVSFANALRQLCDYYRLQAFRDGPDTYTLRPSGSALRPVLPRPRGAGYVEKEGVVFWVPQLYVETRRTVNFRPDPPHVQNTSTLRFQVQLRMKAGDAATIAGIENLRAQDDRGTRLVGQETRAFPRPFRDTFPDEWDDHYSLSGPHPSATKLEWLEGDLMVYSRMVPLTAEVPLALPEAGLQRQLGDVSVDVLRIDPVTRALSLRVTVPRPVAFGAPPPEHGVTATLIGASGRRYSPTGASQTGQGGQQGMVYNVNLGFGGLEEATAKLILERTEKGEPRRLLTFRMESIPLGSGAFVPPAAPPRERGRASE